MPKRSLLWLEFVLLCVAVPGFIILGRHAQYMFGFLWAATLYACVVLYISHRQKISEWWRWSAVTWGNLKPILFRWVIASIGMGIFLYFYEPSLMFNLIERNPGILPFLLVGYPVLSALPQELVFCTFFFARYAVLFITEQRLVLASAITFAYAHMLYINPVAPLLSFFGGMIFARTYARHHSLALVTIEHALYGNSLFIIGLGRYFYSGGVPAN